MSYLLTQSEQDILKRITKQQVRLAAPDNVILANDYLNLDGVSLVDEDRVLLNNQTLLPQNGVYTWDSTTRKFTRAKDALDGMLVAGTMVAVEEGSSSDTFWILAADNPIVVGTTDIRFIQVNGPMFDGAVALVNPRAQNAADNGNLSTPFVTVQAGLDALAQIAPAFTYKSTCLVAPGVYDETVFMRAPRTCLVGIGAGYMDTVIAPSASQYPALVVSDGRQTGLDSMLAGGPGGYTAAASGLTTTGDPPPTDCEVVNINLRGNGSSGYGCLTVASNTERVGVAFRQVISTNWVHDFSYWYWKADNEVVSCPNRAEAGLGRVELWDTTLNVKHSSLGPMYMENGSGVDMQHSELRGTLGSTVLSVAGSSLFGLGADRESSVCLLFGNVSVTVSSQVELWQSTIRGSLTVDDSQVTIRGGQVGGSVNLTTSSTLTTYETRFDSSMNADSSSVDLFGGSVNSSLYFAATSSIDAEDVEFSSSFTLNDSQAVLHNCFVSGSTLITNAADLTATMHDGGGAFTATDSTVTLRGGQLYSNFTLNGTSIGEAHDFRFGGDANTNDTSLMTLTRCNVGDDVTVDDGTAEFTDVVVGDAVSLLNGATLTLFGGEVRGIVTLLHTGNLTASNVFFGNSFGMSSTAQLELNGGFVTGAVSMSNDTVLTSIGTTFKGNVSGNTNAILNMANGSVEELSSSGNSSIDLKGMYIRGDLTLSTGTGTARMIGGYYEGTLTDTNKKLVWIARPFHTFRSNKDAYDELPTGVPYFWVPKSVEDGQVADTSAPTVYTGSSDCKATCTDGVALYFAQGNNLHKRWILEDGSLDSTDEWLASGLGAHSEIISCLATDGELVFVGFEDTSGGGHAAEGLTVVDVPTGVVVRTDTAGTSGDNTTVSVVSNGDVVACAKGNFVYAWDIYAWTALKWSVDRGALALGVWADATSVWDVGIQPGAGWDIEQISIFTGSHVRNFTLPTTSPAEGIDIVGDADNLYLCTIRDTRTDTGFDATVWCVEKEGLVNAALRWSCDTLISNTRSICQTDTHLCVGDSSGSHRISKDNGSRGLQWSSGFHESRSSCCDGRHVFSGQNNNVKGVAHPTGPKLMWRVDSDDKYRHPNFVLVQPVTK
jgi:hypothetical protein